MIDLFPGLPGYLLMLLAMIIAMPALPWQVPLTRVLAASMVLFFNVRYLAWRFNDTLPPTGLTPAYIWAIVVFAAEFLAISQMTLHTFLFTRLSDRREEADRHEHALRQRSSLPSVDVFIPTVNEPLSILERTLEAAIDLDYPNAKIWVLDDGARDWLRNHCAKIGVGYFRRPNRKGFKSGNINYALSHTHNELILCIDADFVVYPNFLYRTVGFMADPDIALVQTPGNLTNPDPVQYNLLGEQAWPEEQRVFTDIVQPARDTWDNAFCYGGTFLIRRAHLQEIGGMPEDSLTEDLYSSYLLRARGYTVRYLNEVLSEGLAAEGLAQFIKQRCRWALGTLQCLYLKGGPLRSRGLSLLDRLFFLDPIIFYLSFFWPFFILIAPCVYWWTGLAPFNAEVGHTITMLLPRMAVTMVVLYWLTNRRVVPVVSELGRVVGIFYFIPAILRGLFHPFGHSFQVTLKGEVRDRYLVQWPVLRGFAILAVITVCGMLLNLSPYGFQHLLWDANASQVLAFSIFDFWMLFLAALICIERPNREYDGSTATTQGNFPAAAGALLKRIVVA
jgi:cellulose synthase (UDP-forming)